MCCSIFDGWKFQTISSRFLFNIHYLRLYCLGFGFLFCFLASFKTPKLSQFTNNHLNGAGFEFGKWSHVIWFFLLHVVIACMVGLVADFYPWAVSNLSENSISRTFYMLKDPFTKNVIFVCSAKGLLRPHPDWRVTRPPVEQASTVRTSQVN